MYIILLKHFRMKQVGQWNIKPNYEKNAFFFTEILVRESI